MRSSNGNNKGERQSFIKPLPMCAIPALEILTNFLRRVEMKKSLMLLMVVFCAAPAFAKFVVCEQPTNQDSPVIFEDKVFWTDSRLIDGYNLYPQEVFFKQLLHGNDIWINNIETSGPLSDAWGDYVIFSGGSRGYGGVYSLSEQKEVFRFPVTCVNASGSPRIHNNIVVWRDRRNDTGYIGSLGSDLYGYNLDTATEFAIFTGFSNSLIDQINPVIYGDIVVWVDSGYEGGAEATNITAKNIVTGEVFNVCNASGRQDYPDIYGNTIVWADSRNGSSQEIYGFNIETRTEFLIAQNGYYPKIYGDVVVFTRPVSSQSPYHPWCPLYGYNLKSQVEFLISDSNSVNGPPDIYRELVVWPQSVHGDLNLYGENVEKLQSEAITLGQVKTGTTVGNSGIDFTEKGYNDNIDTWYNFTAPSNGDYVIGTLGSNFDTTLAVFDNDYKEIEFNDNYNCKQSKLTLRASAGVKYYIRIAGHNGQTGNYRLSVINDGPEPLMSDLNADGNVNNHDFAILAFEWLKSNN